MGASDRHFFVLLLFSWLGIDLSRQSDGVATIWFTNGLLFAVVVTRPRRVWIPYFIAGFVADTLADMLYGDPLKLAAGVSLANSVEVITSSRAADAVVRQSVSFDASASAAGVSGRGGGWRDGDDKRAGGLVDAAVCGCGAVVDAVSHLVPGRCAGDGDHCASGLYSAAAGIFCDAANARGSKETLLLLTVPAVATALVFSYNKDPLIFFIFPALLLVVFRLGFPGTVLSIFVIALISICFTVSGHGPLMLITGSNLLHRIVIEQIFLAVAIFTFFPVAALLEERKELEISLQKSEQQYRELAKADALTGLANRRGFDERLEEEWTRAAGTGQSLALLLIDVDLFKSYNDIYGHVGGDACLRCIARVIADTLQRHSDVAARFGGEEFAVILPDTELEAAMRVAENIRQAVAGMNMPHSGNPEGLQTISIGVAAGVPGQNGSLVSLLTASDHALYRAKYLGRNRVEGAAVATPLPEMSRRIDPRVHCPEHEARTAAGDGGGQAS